MCKAQSGGARGVRNVGGFPYVSGMLARTMRLSFVQAAESDAAAIAALRVATANDLTERFGRGHWSGEATARGVIAGMHDATIWIARRGASIVGTFRLSSLKPWAIDISRFAPASMPLYLTDMAVLPDQQGHGLARGCHPTGRIRRRGRRRHVLREMRVSGGGARVVSWRAARVL
jgi:hypothetical protein